MKWWRGEQAILRTGERFDGAIVTVGDLQWQSPYGIERCEVVLPDGRRMTVFSRDMRRPRGVFPRDDYAFRADYDGDDCPRDTRERKAFLAFIEDGLHPMSFTAWVHTWRGNIRHRSAIVC